MPVICHFCLHWLFAERVFNTHLYIIFPCITHFIIYVSIYILGTGLHSRCINVCLGFKASGDTLMCYTLESHGLLPGGRFQIPLRFHLMLVFTNK